MSGGVGLRLLLSVVHWSIWKYLWDVCWVSVVYRWVVWGYLSGFQGNLRRLNVFWGHLGSHSLQYGTKTLFWDSPKSKTFFHVTAYKLSKNH